MDDIEIKDVEAFRRRGLREQEAAEAHADDLPPLLKGFKKEED
jgi:hypothetical protein